MKKDMNWLKGQLEKFEEEQPHYVALEAVMTAALRVAQKQISPLGYVKTRVKEAGSFAEKCVRKSHKYDEPAFELTDLCGARVVAQSKREVDEVCEFIRGNFLVDKANSENKLDLLGTSKFGYLSVHFIVQIPEDLADRLGLSEEVAGQIAQANHGRMRKAEIQVRTETENFWANGMHDRFYKTDMEIPPEFEREANRISAQLESADRSFGELMDRVDAYQLDYGGYMTIEQMSHEIEVLTTLLTMEGIKLDRAAMALKIAKIAKAKGDWDTVISATREYLSTPCTIQAELQLEHGLALCKKCVAAGDTRDPSYAEGQDLITIVARPNEDQDSTSGLKPRRLRARALAALAWTHQQTGKRAADRRDYFRAACILDSANPYHLRDLLKEELNTPGDRETLSLVEPQIRSAITACEDHIRVGIEMPQAQFARGFLSFLTGQHNECMLSYAHAIAVSNSVHPIEEELRSITLLRDAQRGEKVAKLEQIRIMLELGRVAKVRAAGGEADLDCDALCRDLKSPVTIIAGSTDPRIESEMRPYGKLLTEALENIEGNIISGGTDTGICGALGQAAAALNEVGSKAFTAYGYLPQLLPCNANRDKRYDELIEAGKEFSHRQILQYWVDILSSGTSARDVRLIGIGGGSLSMFEYQFALALGATIGLLKGTARSSGQLLKDEPKWAAGRAIPLPKDPMTLRAFMLSSVTDADPGRFEDAARKVHAAFSEQKLEELRKEVAIQSWEELSEGMKHSNRHQVAFAGHLLRAIGLDLRPATGTPFPNLVDVLEENLEKLAAMEHGRWNVERLLEGWRYAREKDVDKKLHHCLIPWAPLPANIKKYDYEPIRNLPHVLEAAGLEAYRPCASSE